MNSSEWAERVKNKACVFSMYCRRTPFRAHLCEAHWESRRLARAAYGSKRYLKKKLAGLCVTGSCKSMAEPDNLRCAVCQKETKRLAIARRKKVRFRRKALVNQRRRVRARIKLGLCLRCNGPLTTKTLCEKHRQDVIDRYDAKHPRVKRVEKCSGCKKLGHRANTCKERIAEAPLRIEDFIYRRGTDPNQEAQESA